MSMCHTLQCPYVQRASLKCAITFKLKLSGCTLYLAITSGVNKIILKATFTVSLKHWGRCREACPTLTLFLSYTKKTFKVYLKLPFVT